MANYDNDLIIEVLTAIDTGDLEGISDEDLDATLEWADRNLSLAALDDMGQIHAVEGAGYRVARAVQRVIREEKRLRARLRAEQA